MYVHVHVNIIITSAWGWWLAVHLLQIWGGCCLAAFGCRQCSTACGAGAQTPAGMERKWWTHTVYIVLVTVCTCTLYSYIHVRRWNWGGVQSVSHQDYNYSFYCPMQKVAISSLSTICMITNFVVLFSYIHDVYYKLFVSDHHTYIMITNSVVHDVRIL